MTITVTTQYHCTRWQGEHHRPLSLALVTALIRGDNRHTVPTQWLYQTGRLFVPTHLDAVSDGTQSIGFGSFLLRLIHSCVSSDSNLPSA